MRQEDKGKRIVAFLPTGETTTGTITEIFEDGHVFELTTDTGTTYRLSDLTTPIKFKGES